MKQKKSKKESFKVTFWGVRGSIPTPGKETHIYGGNTSCIEVTINDTRFILDAGSGLTGLGTDLITRGPLTAHILFTHFHWDHIQGLPFFIPAYIPNNEFHFYGPPNPKNKALKQILAGQMKPPYFPVPFDIMASKKTYTTLEPGSQFKIGLVTIQAERLNHSETTIGYRISYKDHHVAYVSDTEHPAKGLDQNVLKLAHKADILIYDAMYTDEQYHSTTSSKIGWGHSTWQEGIKIANASDAKKLVLFHHAPLHNDKVMANIERQAKKAFKNCLAAREGLTLTLL